jgi:hypothetical protein
MRKKHGWDRFILPSEDKDASTSLQRVQSDEGSMPNNSSGPVEDKERVNSNYEFLYQDSD